MLSKRGPVVFAATVILVFSLLTGPSLGLISVPSSKPMALGTGTATLTIQSTPDVATLDGSTYTDVHRINVPPVIVTVSNVSGSPLLTLSLDIDELNYSRGSVYTLSGGMNGRHSFAIQQASLDSDQVQNRSYDGRLRIVLRDDSGKTVLAERNVTVEVTG